MKIEPEQMANAAAESPSPAAGNSRKPARKRRMAREPAAAETSSPAPARTPRTSKNDIVTALLRRPEGATLEDMITATGWLPHSTRAVLTGLRKKGHVINKSKRGDVTCYRIADAA